MEARLALMRGWPPSKSPPTRTWATRWMGCSSRLGNAPDADRDRQEGPQRRSFPSSACWWAWGSSPTDCSTLMTLTSGLLPYLLMGYFVLAFGDNVEDVMGPGRYLVYLLVALGLCGGLAISVNEDPLVAVPVGGLLGAVSSVLAVYLFLYPRARLSLLVFFKGWSRCRPGCSASSGSSHSAYS